MQTTEYLPVAPPYILPRYPITAPRRNDNDCDPQASIPWQFWIVLAAGLLASYLSLG